MIAIVDYGSGNVQAIANIYKRMNVPHVLAADPEQLLAADRFILPGVGAFDKAFSELERSGMKGTLERCVLDDEKPILGICVGMQLLARESEEGGVAGLGWIDGVVRKMGSPVDERVHLPHMGWNMVAPTRRSELFVDVDLHRGYYFLHSYCFSCADRDDELASTTYGVTFTSIVNRKNIFGVQFHPEKSHQAGIQLLRNFGCGVVCQGQER